MREAQIVSIVISSISILVSLTFLAGHFVGWLLENRGPRVQYTVRQFPDGSRVFEGKVPQDVLDTARKGDLWFW